MRRDEAEQLLAMAKRIWARESSAEHWDEGEVLDSYEGAHGFDEQMALEQRVEMPERARARNTDPSTSHAAALSVSDLRPKQRAVLRVLRWKGPMSDDALCQSYREAQKVAPAHVPPQSVSGIRTRRSELAAARMVEPDGEVRLRSGRMAILWKPTTKGMEL